MKEKVKKTKKTREEQRTALYSTIWGIANDLRGSVDGWDFKHYILGLLFYRYISENLTTYINKAEIEAGNTGFDYASYTEPVDETIRTDIINTRGFFIHPHQLFSNVQARAKEDENLNETLANIFKDIEGSSKGFESEESFKGLFDDLDVNSNKLGTTVAKRNEKLVLLLDGIGSMDLGDIQDGSIDAFGDAYEYLMGMYASNAGKSGGEYFTPQEVSELVAKLTVVGKDSVNKVYDPACGSGSLLLQFAKVLGKENVHTGFYGQELNITTHNLCRINMFLHDIDFDKFNIGLGDTLTDPMNCDKEPFEAIVSNPPYSVKWEGKDNPLLLDDPRFSPAGVLAPKSKADLAFVMHSLSWLAPNGRAAIVCFPGIFYRGGAEQKIRKYLVESNVVDALIQLPENLFYGTSISTCILVLNRSKEDDKVLFVDASEEFVKSTNANKMAEDNIARVLDIYKERKEESHVSKLVSVEDIAKEDFNLSVNTYVEAKDTREVIDIVKLNSEIDEIVKKVDELRKGINNIVAEIEV